MGSPRWTLPILSAGLSADTRSIVFRTARRDEGLRYAVTLASPAWGEADLGFDLSGVQAEWTAADGIARESVWLPHLDLTVARAFTKESTEHNRFWKYLERPGRLVLKTQLDLKRMLQPAIQVGAALDYEYPPENVRLTLRSATALRLETGAFEAVGSGDRELRLATTPGADWIPTVVSLSTGPGTDLAMSWNTDEDPRPRALPLRRLMMPWARAPGLVSGPSKPPAEIEGGRWDEGKKLYFGDRLACSKCHMIRGEGGKIGPDLTNLIYRDYDSVLKDIVQPSAAINPDHIAYLVRLRSGEVLAGVVLSSNPDSIELGSVSGEPVKVLRAQIERMEPSKVSLMPENLLAGLSPAQVRDLLTFLLTNPR